MGTTVTNLKTVTDAARERHAEATQKLLAASDASHPLRREHGADMLASDARHEMRNLGQTLVPLLLDELDDARRLLDDARRLLTVRENGIRELVKLPLANESIIIGNWLSETQELRYVEISRGLHAQFMVTLWQLNMHAEDKKVGHGEGATLGEAMQRAQGVIIL